MTNCRVRASISKIAFSMTSILVLHGCSVNGKWNLAEVEPTAAIRDFEYQSLTLQKDGTFYAEAMEGPIRTTSGTYTYEDGTLDLIAHDGARATNDGSLQESGNQLCLVEMWDGRKLKAVMERKE